MINFSVADDTYFNDLAELIRLFEQHTDENFSVWMEYKNMGNEFIVDVFSDKFEAFKKSYRYPFFACSELERKRNEKRHLKAALYRTIGFLTGVDLPYGCLTGIRPTKYYVEIKQSDEFKEGLYGTDGVSFSVVGNSAAEAENSNIENSKIEKAASKNLKTENVNSEASKTETRRAETAKEKIAKAGICSQVSVLRNGSHFHNGINVDEIFRKEFCVTEKKLSLIKRIVEVQKPLRNDDENAYDVFVFIPFCPTKCAYCSFVSLPLNKQKKLVEPYVECLLKELDATKELVRSTKKHIRAVYVGGGTPTSVPAELLNEILKKCDYTSFGATEFTVEAGRPDTITENIADVLKMRGVTRVSVNPQTFNDKTLELIGRKHKAIDVINAYKLVKGKFDVNMDLIAMLPNENFDDFRRSVDIAVRLNPENVTVHTLYMKTGSALKNAGYDNTDYKTASSMVDYACEALSAAGYRPYYMYRQKYTSGSLENVGYAKAGKECVYNIDIMEEDTSILANGAAAISKKWTKGLNLIERNANYKEPLEYIKNFERVLEKQRKFWTKSVDCIAEDSGFRDD